MNDREIIEQFGGNLKSINLDDFRRFIDVIHKLKLDLFKIGVKNEIARFGRKDKGNLKAKFVIGSVYLAGAEIRVNRSDRGEKIISVTKEVLTKEIVDEIAEELNASKSKWSSELSSRNGYLPTDYDLLKTYLPPTKEEVKVLKKIQDDGDLSETEKQTQIQARVGQGKFRNNVIKRAGGKCEITGVADEKLLIASHIHAWAKCDTYEQRLDGDNGLLLSPSLDKLFDKGYISFGDDGRMLVNSKNHDVLEMLIPKASEGLKLAKEPSKKQCGYLKMHRAEHSFPE